MLVQDHEPLEHRCRTLWSLAAGAAAAIVMIVASGLSLDAAPPPGQPNSATLNYTMNMDTFVAPTKTFFDLRILISTRQSVGKQAGHFRG